LTISPPSLRADSYFEFNSHQDAKNLAKSNKSENFAFDDLICCDFRSHYVAPELEVLTTPHQQTTFDGFTVAGRVSGSAVDNAVVAVSIGDVTRTGRSADGLWSVRFEDGCLSRRHAGLTAMTVRVTDQYYQSAQITEPITIDEFVDGHVHIDDAHRFITDTDSRVLVVRGELGLGSHVDGRELVVVLVRDDDEGIAVQTGSVLAGWQYGEWEARIAVQGIDPGAYRVRALLVDKACATLTRVATGKSITIT